MLRRVRDDDVEVQDDGKNVMLNLFQYLIPVQVLEELI